MSIALLDLCDGLHILRRQCEWEDHGFRVLHRTASLSSAPEHTHSGYVFVVVADPLSPEDARALRDLGWVDCDDGYEWQFNLD